MIAVPDNLTETPERHSGRGTSMDVLDEILSSLSLTGGVVIDGEFSGDFCLPAHFGPKHFEPFFPQPETLISYHYVRSGQMVIEVQGQAPEVLDAGTIAILPRNDPHTLASRSGLPPAKANEVSWITEERVHRVSAGTEGPTAAIWCGFLAAEKGAAHPLLDALPPLLTLDVTGGEAQWLDSSMRFLAEQSPSSEVVAKLAELFLAQSIRDYVDELPPGSTGWLKGLTDPAVSKALSIIHTRYAEDLDVESLAREVGVSRSVLGERFTELLGEPPIRYCARWRMRVAANMLRDGSNTARVAYAVGFNSEAAFNRAFKREYGEPPATWKRKVEAAARIAAMAREPQPLPVQEVRYATAKDGTKLAYSMVGDGPPLVKTANWLNHIEHDWKSPLWRHWITEFTAGRSLVRYDERGNGLSDWDTPELSLDAFVNDLECVVDELKLETFDLLAISQGAAVAIAYAVRHPERVRHLVICNGYAAGWAVRAEPAELARREAMLTLTQVGWGADEPTYRQIFTNIYIPEATAEQMGWFNEVQRLSASPENAVRLQRVLGALDVRDLLPLVQTPTLVFHSRNDQAVPFAQGEQLAADIPGAAFIPLESRNHILLGSEPAWAMFTELTREFLGRSESELLRPAAQPDRIDHCESGDGTRIAYAVAGEGFPLVKAPNWITHLARDRSNPVYRHWIAECSRGHSFLRTDMRGFGMSELDPPRFTMDSMVEDLAAAIDDAKFDQCDLLGVAHGAAIAIAYAARHPERVRKLILVNSFAEGWRVRADPDEVAWRNSLMELNRREWSFRRSMLGEMFLTLYFPTADQELIDWHNANFEEIGPVARLQAMIELAADIDVRQELKHIRAQTLICHSRNDASAPIKAGRAVADAIAGSRFVELDSANHILLGNEPAWPVFVEVLRAFLAEDVAPAQQAAPAPVGS
jgi:pimeloyl-ACP methyl ester carboxylesterase/AraC-like DNA-binding protein